MASFGFSVGDFVTCLNLIREVAQALSDSRGSASEYKSLFETLVSLNQTLAASELIYLQWDTQATSPTYKTHSTAMINGILFERQKCKELLESFLKSSQPYTDAFVKERGRAIVRNWRKVTWLFQKEDVNDLERKLQRHLRALRIYTDALFQYESRSHTLKPFTAQMLMDPQKSNCCQCGDNGIKSWKYTFRRHRLADRRVDSGQSLATMDFSQSRKLRISLGSFCPPVGKRSFT